MTRSQMQSAVIQCAVLVTLNSIIFHEINRNAYDGIYEDPVFKNFTNLWNTTSVTTVATNNTTLDSGSTDFNADEPFYLSYLPRNTFVWLLLAPLTYYWQIFLERFFPTRPRGKEVEHAKKEKVDVDVDEGQEEEIVKRWIAQGKVRRSSISWWNTFIKWVLNLSVGEWFFSSLHHFVNGLIRYRSLATVMGSFKAFTLIRLFTQFLSVWPFASLIGFVVVPATKRIVFEAGVNTMEAIFVGAFFRLVIPWVVHTDFAQGLMINITENHMANQAQNAGDGMSVRLIGGPGEL